MTENRKLGILASIYLFILLAWCVVVFLLQVVLLTDAVFYLTTGSPFSGVLWTTPRITATTLFTLVLIPHFFIAKRIIKILEDEQ